jgi:hypothetical protein
MLDVLYLPGFGTTNLASCPVANALRRAAPDHRLHLPCYHPDGNVRDTRVGASLDQFTEIIAQESTGKVHLVGYSFGGLLAALLAAARPELVGNVLLLAPAIDNVARNYEGLDPVTWRMPLDYVDELRTYPPRPHLTRPTTLVHGLLDDDRGGSAPWRIQQWAQAEPFRGVYLLEGIGHSLEPWLSGFVGGSQRHVPTFQQAIEELIAEDERTS